MQVAGIYEFGSPVEILDVPDPRPLAADEVLIEVKAAGIGNWDEIVRTGGWDVGVSAPMALGVEASGVVTKVGRRSTASTWRRGVMPSASVAPPGYLGALAHRTGVTTRAQACIGVLGDRRAFPVPALTAET